MEQIHGVSDGNINISDVLEVLQTTDPEFVECNGDDREAMAMFSGGGVESVSAGSTIGSGDPRRHAYIKILEQPASKALRFRYECEGRSAGSIPGVNSTPENKTYPSIRVENYKGRAIVMVSCVTKDPPYRPHPHNLVGRESCTEGVCTVQISSDNMTVTFANLGIQCVKKKDIQEALNAREKKRVDPYKTGYSHRAQPTSIDLNAVRLCFEVYLEGSQKGKFNIPLTPVVSDPIYDKKAMSDLVICKLSDCSCTVAGGKEMILLCEKVAKEDIQVRFFEERDGQLYWEGFGDFQPTQVHKQVAISFRTPSYRTLEVDECKKVSIQLRRPSDGATSEPLPFEFRPLDSDPEFKRKRKIPNDPSAHLLRHLQAEAEKRRAAQNQNMGYQLNTIKAEPAEREPSPYQMSYGAAGGLSPLYPVSHGAQSPQNPPNLLSAYRQQPSPGRTPSPMEYMSGITRYNILPGHEQQQIPPPFPSQVQQSYAQQQQQQQQQQQMLLNRIISSEQNPNFSIVNSVIPSMVPPNATTTEGVSVMDMDSHQCSFEMGLNQLDSADLAAYSIFDTNLSENLSSSLSLSDIKVSQVESGRTMAGTETAEGNGGSNNNMTDSLTNLTNSTMQEICTLNTMYKNTRDNNG